ncbi:MAG TPA: DegT/DnrJ/EryC1/StrS family aminotransferase [Thermomicrobiales bacterium]|nr:DegT/DnrJ/EryC1/StrS family aminotransferase [Thermomicrobiales bacterium]
MDWYRELGVTPVINATGYVTRLGGSLMLPEVVEAMAAASRAFVSMRELEEAAGRVIAEITGAEAGYVTSGAAAGLTMAAATCIAGADRDRINRLPDTSGVPHTIVIPGPHRDSYDRCFRVAGARTITAGSPDGCTIDDLQRAIGPETAAVAWFSMYEDALSLPPVVDVAHARGVPVIVDAAIALPPTTNLRRFIDDGADLVSFSAGKDMRGPQTAGFLAGRRDLIEPLALHHQDFAANDGVWEIGPELLSPGHGLARPMKVGKEELVGALVALKMYAERDHEVELRAQEEAQRVIAASVPNAPGVKVTTGREQTPGHWVRVRLEPGVAPQSAQEVVDRLANGEPRVMVAASVLGPPDTVTIGTATLQPGEAQIVARRLADILA